MQNAAENRPEASKRRSTRIAQAVPLLITGVDALGRPFQERTSTIAINCHGGRYQSKHYVLKNMWVTLEVPHPQSGEPLRRVRGRITWIQRPRTVRELFQIAVELEAAGNVWGIAFPPSDWVPFNENAAAQVLEDAGLHQMESEFTMDEASMRAEELDNLRVLPGPGSDPSLTLARQMNRLLAEAKQQIQATVREVTARSVEAETRPLLAAVESQLHEAAQRAVREAATRETQQLTRQALNHITESGQDLLRRLHDEWSREAGLRVDAATQEFHARLENIEQQRAPTLHAALDSPSREAVAHVESRLNELAAAADRAESLLNRLNQELEQGSATTRQRIETLLEAKAQKLFARLSDLDAASQRAGNDIATALKTAMETARERLESDRAAGATAWHESIGRSIEEAAQRTAQRLARQTEDAARCFDQELSLRVSAQRQSFEEVAAHAQNALRGLRENLEQETVRARESLNQVQRAAQRVAGQTAGLDEASRTAAADLERRLQTILSESGAELDRRADSALAGLADRVQPVIESASRATLARLGDELEAQLIPHMDRAAALIEKLAAATAAAEQTTGGHERRIQELSDQAAQTAVTHVHETLGRFEREFEESSRAAMSRLLSDLDSKATDTAHTTYESLLKASAWYEKKVQTQMQAAIDKGTEQAENYLRQKAGEMSGLFASELDHYSRSYVGHSQEQMGEALIDVVQSAREQMGSAVAGAVSSFENEIRAAGLEKQRQFESHLGATAEQVRGHVVAIGAEAVSKMESEAAAFLAEFRSKMDLRLSEGVSQARRDLETELAPLERIWKDQRAAQEHQFDESLARMGDASLEGYKQRLESASNSFLVTAVSGLSQQTQALVDNMSLSAEARLRHVAGEVFSGIGETLRQRLLDLSAAFAASQSSSEHNQG